MICCIVCCKVYSTVLTKVTLCYFVFQCRMTYSVKIRQIMSRTKIVSCIVFVGSFFVNKGIHWSTAVGTELFPSLSQHISQPNVKTMQLVNSHYSENWIPPTDQSSVPVKQKKKSVPDPPSLEPNNKYLKCFQTHQDFTKDKKWKPATDGMKICLS